MPDELLLLERRKLDAAKDEDDDDADVLRNVEMTSTPGGTNLRATLISPR